MNVTWRKGQNKKHRAWSSISKNKLMQSHLGMKASNGVDATNLCCKLLPDLQGVKNVASCCLNCKNLPHLLQIPLTCRASTISFCYPAKIKFKHINWLLIGQDDCRGRENSLASENTISIGKDQILFRPFLTSS